MQEGPAHMSTIRPFPVHRVNSPSPNCSAKASKRPRRTVVYPPFALPAASPEVPSNCAHMPTLSCYSRCSQMHPFQQSPGWGPLEVGVWGWALLPSCTGLGTGAVPVGGRA